MNQSPFRTPSPLLASSLALVLAAGALPHGVAAQSAFSAELDDLSPAERVIALGQTDNRVQEHLDYLTNGIGHRLTSSSNLTRACEWAAAQFRSFGLEAWIEEWGTFPVGFERGRQAGGMVVPEEIAYTYRTPAWTPGTPGPVRGRAVLEPKTEEDLADLEGRLEGAWLVRRSGGVPRSLRGQIQEAVSAAGIAGEVRKGGDRIVVFGDQNVDWEELPTLVSVRLLNDHYEDLVERLEEGQSVELEFDVDNRFVPGPVPLYNVVADLKGSELPDEYVIVGGHIDSWHAATGTNDNGTGVATTLEAARLLAASGVRPKRTIRFMLWSGEEQGLLGSRAYVKAHPELMPKISAVLVHDKGTNYLSGISVPKTLAEDLRRVFAPVADLDPEMPFTVSENEGLSRMMGSSDHASFLREGVPGLFWEQDGRTRYGDFWHTHFDTFDSAVPEYQRHSAIVAAVGALGIANLDRLLERDGLFRSGGSRSRATRRVMGVRLSGTEISRVTDGGMAEKAGWQAGDVILSINDAEVANRAEIVRELQQGGPVKVFKLQRGEEVVESTLDYTDTPSEKAREEAAAEKEKKNL